MIIKPTKKSAEVLPPGEYDDAELQQVSYKKENTICLMEFSIQHEGKSVLVPREVPASLDSGPLLDDLSTLNAAGFTRNQIDGGIDPEDFVGRRCRVIVVHKRTSGRKLVATVSVMLPLATSESTVGTPVESKPPQQQAAT